MMAMMQMMQQRMQAPGGQAPPAESRPSRCEFNFRNYLKILRTEVLALNI